ncbi:hypothetical protein QCA50_001097 [Cerrena zonata]|uniref:Protein kinase domain-containing protein n=1 Tax=Cerrena zonata TaxID=2478898 RepID=A0AAW0GYK6_9APHY
MFFVKLKVLLNKSASSNLTRRRQPTLEPSPTDQNVSLSKRVNVGAAPQPSSLAVLANTARGEDAETMFHQMFMEDVSNNCILNVERPISIGTLKALEAGGIRMSKLQSLLAMECDDSSSFETFDVVVPLRIANSQTSAAIEAPEETQIQEQQCLSETLCNNVIALNTTPPRGPLFITNDEPGSTLAVFDSPCIKSSLPNVTPLLYRLTAHRPEQDISILNNKPPRFLLPPPSSVPNQLSTHDFEISGVLGAGAFGTVCAARYKGNGGGVALKVIKKRVGEGKEPVTKPQDVFGPLDVDGEVAKMGSASLKNCDLVVAEWIAMQRLAGANNVVEILGSWHDDDNFFIAMPLYTGGTLQSRLAQYGRFSIEDSRFYLADIISGLAAIHARGIIHRDLKPANVLIDADGHLKIADFGLSRSFEQHASEFERSVYPHLATEMGALTEGRFAEVTNTGCGTPEFIAPEIYKGELYSYNVDMWSLGVMAFKMIVGRSPWAGAETNEDVVRRITEGVYKIEEQEQERFGIDEDTVLFIRRALDKDPSTRASATQLLGGLWLKKFDRNLKAPWIPSASQIRVSSHGFGLLNVGTHGRPTEDPFPFFGFISPKLADAPAAMPTLVSLSPSSSRSFTLPPAPPLMGYPSSASGLQSTSLPYYAMHHAAYAEDEYQAPPFPTFWAAPQDSDSDSESSAFLMRPGVLNLAANALDASPVKSIASPFVRPHITLEDSDSSSDFVMRPGALNLATHPIDSSSSSARDASELFARFLDNRNEPADVPTSVSRESFNPQDFALQEESASLPFVPYRPSNLHLSRSNSLADVIDPFDDCWRIRDEPTNVPTSVSQASFDAACYALREESASLPFMLYRKSATSSCGQNSEPSQLFSSPQPYGKDLQDDRRSSSTSISSLDILALVHREESGSLPVFSSNYPHIQAPLPSPLASPEGANWLSVLPPSFEDSTPVTEVTVSPASLTTSMDRLDILLTPLLLADATLYSTLTNSPDLTLCAPEGSFLTSSLQYTKVTPGKDSPMTGSVTLLSPGLPLNSPPDLTVEEGSSFVFEYSRASTESTPSTSPSSPSLPSPSLPSSSPPSSPLPASPSPSSTLSTSIDSVENREEIISSRSDQACDPASPASFTKETPHPPLIRSRLVVLNWLRTRIRCISSPFLSSFPVSRSSKKQAKKNKNKKP